MDVDKLIGEVFVRQSLWDQKDKNHHNRFILDKLWDEVAIKLDTSRLAVRNKWKALRDKFRTTLASIPKPRSGDEGGPSYESNWKHFASLLFLKDQFTPRVSSGNFKTTHEDDRSIDIIERDLEESIVDIVDSAVSMQSNLEEISLSSPQNVSYPNSPVQPNNIPTRKRRLVNDDIGTALLEIERKKVKYLEEKKQQKSVEDDDLNFFKSLLPHVKEFSPCDKMSYRMKILQVTHDFMSQSIQETESNQNENL